MRLCVLISLRPSLRTLHLSLQSSTSSSWSFTSSSMWIGSEKKPLCASANEESGLLGQQRPSHRLRAQFLRRLPLLRDHWNFHPGVLQRQPGPRTCMTRRSVTTPSAERSLHQCSLRSEKNQRAVHKLITLLKKVCCQVSRCLSVM